MQRGGVSHLTASPPNPQASLHGYIRGAFSGLSVSSQAQILQQRSRCQGMVPSPIGCKQDSSPNLSLSSEFNTPLWALSSQEQEDSDKMKQLQKEHSSSLDHREAAIKIRDINNSGGRFEEGQEVDDNLAMYETMEPSTLFSEALKPDCSVVQQLYQQSDTEFLLNNENEDVFDERVNKTEPEKEQSPSPLNEEAADKAKMARELQEMEEQIRIMKGKMTKKKANSNPSTRDKSGSITGTSPERGLETKTSTNKFGRFQVMDEVDMDMFSPNTKQVTNNSFSDALSPNQKLDALADGGQIFNFSFSGDDNELPDLNYTSVTKGDRMQFIEGVQSRGRPRIKREQGGVKKSAPNFLETEMRKCFPMKRSSELLKPKQRKPRSDKGKKRGSYKSDLPPATRLSEVSFPLKATKAPKNSAALYKEYGDTTRPQVCYTCDFGLDYDWIEGNECDKVVMCKRCKCFIHSSCVKNCRFCEGE